MKNRCTHPINYIAVWVAIISFTIGTMLLLSFKVTGAFMLALIGYYYVILAGILNSFMVFLLLINAVVHLKDFKENLITIAIILLNIPIAIYYQDIAL